jgi:hypothetical protein
MAVTTLASATIDPTEISNPPLITAKVCPKEANINMEACLMIFRILSAVAKLVEMIEKKINRKAIMIGIPKLDQ